MHAPRALRGYGGARGSVFSLLLVMRRVMRVVRRIFCAGGRVIRKDCGDWALRRAGVCMSVPTIETATPRTARAIDGIFSAPPIHWVGDGFRVMGYFAQDA